MATVAWALAAREPAPSGPPRALALASPRTRPLSENLHFGETAFQKTFTSAGSLLLVPEFSQCSWGLESSTPDLLPIPRAVPQTVRCVMEVHVVPLTADGVTPAEGASPCGTVVALPNLAARMSVAPPAASVTSVLPQVGAQLAPLNASVVSALETVSASVCRQRHVHPWRCR
jgi:hypothetical protein